MSDEWRPGFRKPPSDTAVRPAPARRWTPWSRWPILLPERPDLGRPPTVTCTQRLLQGVGGVALARERNGET